MLSSGDPCAPLFFSERLDTNGKGSISSWSSTCQLETWISADFIGKKNDKHLINGAFSHAVESFWYVYFLKKKTIILCMRNNDLVKQPAYFSLCQSRHCCLPSIILVFVTQSWCHAMRFVLFNRYFMFMFHCSKVDILCLCFIEFVRVRLSSIWIWNQYYCFEPDWLPRPQSLQSNHRVHKRMTRLLIPVNQIRNVWGT